MRWVIVEEHSFSQNAQRLFGSAQRADVCLKAVSWELGHAKSFTKYPAVAKTSAGPLYMTKTQPQPAFPVGVVVYFTVDTTSRQIVLRDIAMVAMGQSTQAVS